jgi:hypothetical protein
MRRDLLYLGAVTVNAALMVEFGYALLLAAAGPAWLVRRGSLRPLWTAPLALIALAVVMPLLLDLFGADCPVEGMDYLDQCNGLAQVAMVFLYGGVIAVQVAIAAAVGTIPIRAGRVAFDRYDRRRTSGSRSS